MPKMIVLVILSFLSFLSPPLLPSSSRVTKCPPFVSAGPWKAVVVEQNLKKKEIKFDEKYISSRQSYLFIYYSSNKL